jgi:two-component system NtrC family sensor kinase
MSEPTPNDKPQRPGDLPMRILEQSPVAVLATDDQLRIVLCNPAAGELLGLDPDELLGGDVGEVGPAAFRDPLRRAGRAVLAGESPEPLELDLPAGEGTRRLLALPAAIATEADRPGGVALWLLDRTGDEQLARRLAQSEKMASLGTLAGGVAHHFNNILGGVATFVDYALNSGNPGAMRRALEMTAEAAARVSRITESLLSFAEHGHRRQHDLVDLTEVVLTFVHLVERPLAEHDIDLKLDLQPIPTVSVEAGRLHQVLGNLLSNAEDAMPSGGSVTIRLDRSGDRAVLTFADTGAGIARENLRQVFEPFFTTKGLLAGGERSNPGLGLSVVHGLVLEMGGDIRVDSTPGEGTTFTITLPLRRR